MRFNKMVDIETHLQWDVYMSYMGSRQHDIHPLDIVKMRYTQALV